jgi:hypothetical protein
VTCRRSNYFAFQTSGKQMKLPLFVVGITALLLSACGKEAPKPAPQAAPEAPKAAAPAAPAATVSDDDKKKAMDAAKAAAKSAGGRSE